MSFQSNRILFFKAQIKPIFGPKSSSLWKKEVLLGQILGRHVDLASTGPLFPEKKRNGDIFGGIKW